MDPEIIFLILTTAVKIIVFTFVCTLPIIAYSTYAERRVSSMIQGRVGPNRVCSPLTLFGAKKDIPFSGLLQPLADGLKAFLKEDLVPAHVRKFFFWIAPALTAAPAFLCICIIPFGSSITVFDLYTPALRRVNSVPDSHSEFSELSADHPESRSFLREISTDFLLNHFAQK